MMVVQQTGLGQPFFFAAADEQLAGVWPAGTACC
jgi:hypothetical protein